MASNLGRRSFARHLFRGDAGQSLVETALLLPVLCFLILGGADLARAFAVQLAVQNGARAGSEAAVIDFTPASDDAVARALDEMARTPGLDPSLATVTVTTATSSGGTCPEPASLSTPCYVTVRVRYAFTTIVRWPLIPSSFSFDRSTVMRRYF